jgi:hypothetical protein
LCRQGVKVDTDSLEKNKVSVLNQFELKKLAALTFKCCAFFCVLNQGADMFGITFEVCSDFAKKDPAFGYLLAQSYQRDEKGYLGGLLCLVL